MNPMTLFMLLLSTILFGLILYVSLRWIARLKIDDKWEWSMLFLVSALTVWLLPIVGDAVGGALKALGDTFQFIPHTQNHLGQITPILIFLLFMSALHFLLKITWDRAVFVALVSLILLYLMFSIIPYVGEYGFQPLKTK